MMADIIDRPSPNHDPRPRGAKVDILLLHYTGMESAGAALERMCDPAAKVSAHYMIDEDGTVYRLVDEKQRAWHAGVSSWRGDADVNGRSVGVELVNPGHEFGYRKFAEVQMTRLEQLGAEIVLRHSIPAANVLGHSDVAPDRKQDPGELFDWAALARAGVGLWPGPDFRPRRTGPDLGVGDVGPEVAALQGALKSYGYGIEDPGVYGERTGLVVAAFQRHFRPLGVDGSADPETCGLIDHMATLSVHS
jgi:N-acetylmuramoyl-L-alanine amidase